MFASQHRRIGPCCESASTPATAFASHSFPLLSDGFPHTSHAVGSHPTGVGSPTGFSPTRPTACPTLWDSVQIPQDAYCTSHSTSRHCGTVSFLSGQAGCQAPSCRQRTPHSVNGECCGRAGREVVPVGPTFQLPQSARSASVRVQSGLCRLGTT